MFTLIAKGGPIMLALLACSVWGIYIVAYKWLYLKSNTIKDPNLMEKIKTQLESLGKRQTCENLMRGRSLPVRSLGKAIQVAHLPEETIKEELTQFNKESLTKLDQNMNFLSSIITVAPILGLLGTVLGLMDIFNVISDGQIGEATVLSKGIAEALVTTVSGLSIAVPFIFFYQLLNHKIDRFVTDLNASIDGLVRYIQSSPHIPE